MDNYDHLRKKIEHEDNLVHQRMTWMISLQGFLFTAYGFSLMAQATALNALGAGAKKAEAPEGLAAGFQQFSDQLETLRTSMMCLGVTGSIAALVGIGAAFNAIRELPTRSEGAPKDDIRSSLVPWFLGNLYAVFLPLTSGCVWLYILDDQIAVGGWWLFLLLIIAAFGYAGLQTWLGKNNRTYLMNQ